MGRGSDDRRAVPGAGRLRGVRDIRTSAALRSRAPQPASQPPLGARISLRPVSRSSPPRPEGEGLGPARAWLFVKDPSFARHQPRLAVDRVEEPEVDLIDEGQTLAVLVEFPGVREEELDVQVNGDVLSLSTKAGLDEPPPRYYREVLLPFAVDTRSVQRTFHNGVLELELRRASSSPGSERLRRERR